MNIQQTGGTTADQWRLNTQEQQATRKAAQQKTDADVVQGTTTLDGEAGAGGRSAAAERGAANTAGQDSSAVKQAMDAAANGTAVSGTDSNEEDAAYQAIVQKADSGQTLTAAELSQLRAKDPARYNRAMKAMQARTELRAQMEKDPSHASRTAKEAISSVQALAQEDSDALNSAHRSVDNAAVVKALNDEYNRFARQYDQIILSSPTAAGED